MATLLYRIGSFSFRRRWLVTSVWVLLLALLGVGAATMSGKTSNEFSIPGTEAQQAIDQLRDRFPQANAGGATARVVFGAPAGQTVADPANQAAIAAVVQRLGGVPQVANVLDPFTAKTISPDGHYAFAQVTYKVQGPQLTDADKDALFASAQPGRDAGLVVEFGGDALRANPETGIVEVLGVAIAALVLIITLGSLIAAGLPLLTAVAGVGVGVAGLLLAARFVDINANSLILAGMLGVAVGIDYALFIVSRYRHELTLRSDPAEAAGRAVGTAGSAVLFAGLTVIIALAGLTVVGIPMLASMGLSAAATVAVAVLVALTLLPALLGFVGPRIAKGKLFGRSTPDPESDSGPTPMGERWVKFVVKMRWPVLVLALLGLGVVAIPAADLRLGLPDDGMAATDTTQRKAYDMLSAGFGPGFNAPLTLVVSTNGKDPQATIGAVAGTLQKVEDVVYVSPLGVSPDGGTALLAVIPKEGPNAESTTDLVNTIRDQSGEIKTATGADIAITGPTALNIDVSQTLNDAMLPYLGVVVGLAFLLLMLVFRSILVPLKATAGFLLSVAATFGAVVAVFQWGWLSSVFGVKETGPIMSMLPVLLIGILFGLAMDYQVFLVTRMREEFVHGADAQASIVAGFRHGARVVTAAAIIMISVFGGFVFSGEPLIQSIGFALAFGVLVDAFIVRMTLVPAVMSLLGRAAWWLPKWLGRILPNVDVEGEKLQAKAPAVVPVEVPAAVSDDVPVRAR
ncbi:RND superfamily putative drug exporter [Allocatelliglobosispora scoriae]|uniref:RND superfamily putative drug exporter n=1 Tax=Allocatelliglobosispora scoriae TaxID=643052 RepID=A0A841C3Q1_9ACTN|nr:MMPL family transporter [Allocatelliglobosispora scoriae]MBB5873763.1 RND superfamily putative drug exporter [Allocatelliglobosispora scoriae]